MALASTGYASDNSPQPDALSTTQRPVIVDLAADTFPVEGAPWGVAVDGVTVWVSDAARGVLLQIDAASGQVLGEAATGAPRPSRHRPRPP